MKRHFLMMMAGLLCCLAGLSSCSDTDEGNTTWTPTPGQYKIEMNIDAQAESPVSRGVLEDKSDFDNIYTPDYIYLHDKQTKQYIKLPVYNHTCGGTKADSCRGFRYTIDVDVNGDATITPLNQDDTPVDGQLLTVKAGDKCYFSSVEEDTWQLDKDQIDDSGSTTVYKRKNNVNKEIYRSAEDYIITDLAANSDITMHRACAGFTLACIFYDSDNIVADEDQGTWKVTTSPGDFKRIMGDAYTNWYIKIYIGGSCMTDSYDIANQTSTGDEKGGYYSTGDQKLFIEGNLDAQKFLPIVSTMYGSVQTMYDGFGYVTKQDNYLFTPLVADQEVNVYVLIKHWDGAEGTKPDEEWLKKDEGALYTKVNFTEVTTSKNNCYYVLGMMMDLHLLYQAWDKAGGFEKEKTESTTTSATNSRAGVFSTLREFNSDKAITFVEIR